MNLVDAIKLVIALARANITPLEKDAHAHTNQHYACDLLEQHAVLISLGYIGHRSVEKRG